MSLIHVCPLSALETTLETSKARWLISLSAPGKNAPRPHQIDGGHLALEFNDINEEQIGLIAPEKNHLVELFDFAKQWNLQGPLLIQCWMGISRSTAAALLVSAYFNQARNMNSLAQNLRQNSPMATPNKRMIELGDGLLNLDGRLIAAVAKIGRGAEASKGQAFSLEL